MNDLEERIGRVLASWPFAGSSHCLGCGKHADGRLYLSWAEEGGDVAAHIGVLIIKGGGKYFLSPAPQAAVASFSDLSALERVILQMEAYIGEYLETRDPEAALVAAQA